MKKIIALLTIVAVAGMLLGCGAMVMSPASGMLYTDTKGPVGVGSSTNDSKSGEACATAILIFATGDASIGAAMKAGGIKNIAYVDSTSMSILGVYGKYCTVVKGN